jgi:hypothetical protein
VSISGDAVVVGATLDDVGGSQSGSAYVFIRSGNTWFEQAKLTALDGAANDNFGYSVAISGDTVVVGSYQDDDGRSNSGSVYIYRFSVPLERALLVYDNLGTELGNAASAPDFPGLLLGASMNITFGLANAGVLDLDIQSVSLGGADAGQFSLTLPDISPAADLSTNESLDYTITFSPAGSSGLRNATVLIISNDTDSTLFSFSIAGLGLSNTEDADADGMNDWAEYSLRFFGFDWETTQTNEVNHYYEHSPAAGLYTEAELAAVHGSAVLVERDVLTNTASFVIGLEQSVDLDVFSSITIDPAKLSVDGDGNIRYEVDVPAGRKFFRAGFKP